MKQKPTILLTGGGSGGHITPSLSVAREIKKMSPQVRLVFVGQKGDRMQQLVRKEPVIDSLKLIYAGKIRRYHGVSPLRQLLDIKTQLFNLRDVFLIFAGFVQSVGLLLRHRPRIIFVKGGYVGVPVATAARLLHIPYITHDSDALAGLANRSIAKGARLHATGMPAEFYNYPATKTVYTGVPVDSRFNQVSKTTLSAAKAKLGIDRDCQVMLVIGGGLGAQRLNELVVTAAPLLFDEYKKLYIIHLTGHKLYQDTMDAYAAVLSNHDTKRLTVLDFTPAVYRYSAAADLIVTRAGATAISEFARQAKACLLVPNPLLAGGHQLKNAQQLAANEAVAVCADNATVDEFVAAVSGLLDNDSLRAKLAKNLHSFGIPDASQRIASLLIKEAGI